MGREKKIEIYNSISLESDTADICIDLFSTTCMKGVSTNLKSISSDITDRYRLFGNLTSLYAVWKNSKADYIGFCQDGYYLMLHSPDEPCEPVRDVPDDEEEQQPISLDAVDYLKELQKADGLSEQFLCEYKDAQGKDVKQMLSEKLFSQKDIHRCTDMVAKLYPEYRLCALEYLKQKKYLPDTAFILTSACFNELCTFIFSILFELEKELDLSAYPTGKLNVLKVLGTYLFGVFMRGARKKHGCVLRHRELSPSPLPLSKMMDLEPEFEKNGVVAILSSSDLFSPYLGVCIQSIIDAANPDNNYDIIVFERGITYENKKRVRSLARGRENVSIRFFNVSQKMERLNFFVNDARISQETYYGLLIPWFLPNFHKAIIMDCDMIVKHDLAELYQEDLAGYVAGGVRDVVLQGWLNDPRNDTYHYYVDDLNAKDPSAYVNGGLLLLDFDNYRETVTKELVLHYINNYQFRVVDQDIFNLLLEGKMKALDPKWNHMIYVIGAVSAAIASAPDSAQQGYFRAQKDPGIIHYASENKPWKNPELEFASDFWHCARETPFYELILLRMLTGYMPQNPVIPSVPIEDHRSGVRKIADVVLPVGSKRRKILKVILPKGSRRWRFCKKIYFFFCPKYRPVRRK